MYTDNLNKYDAACELLPHIKRKGKTMPYTSSNGYMFSLLNKDGEFGVRLSPEDKAEFHENFGSEPFLSHGAVMKDYVIFPNALLSDKEATAKWIQKGYLYVNTLKPK